VLTVRVPCGRATLEQNSRGALDTLDAELKARDRELAAKDEQLAGLEAEHAGLRADIQAATAQLRDLQDARQRLAGQEAAFAQAQSLADTVPVCIMHWLGS
jgi:septal ring factor EnvC (AmiA/AmiB activator)